MVTPCFQNRKSAIFEKLENGYGAGTTELSIVRVYGNSIEKKYLLLFFKSNFFIANGIKSFSGTAGQQRIHKNYLATCLLNIHTFPLHRFAHIILKPDWQCNPAPGKMTAAHLFSKTVQSERVPSFSLINAYRKTPPDGGVHRGASLCRQGTGCEGEN